MKKILILVCPIIMLVGCFNTAEREMAEDIGFIEDPEPLGLLPDEPITCIEYNNCYLDYDSLSCYYGIKVIITDSDWSKKHDSLHVQRINIDNDTNWWDYASLYGKNRGDTEWQEICNKGVRPDTLDSCYYRMLDILDVIGHVIESRLCHLDSVDWESNQDYYESLFRRKRVEFFICGKTRIIRPTSM